MQLTLAFGILLSVGYVYRVQNTQNAIQYLEVLGGFFPQDYNIPPVFFIYEK